MATQAINSAVENKELPSQKNQLSDNKVTCFNVLLSITIVKKYIKIGLYLRHLLTCENY